MCFGNEVHRGRPRQVHHGQEPAHGGQVHGFFTMVDLLPGAGTAMDFIADGIEKHLAAGLVAVGRGNAGPA